MVDKEITKPGDSFESPNNNNAMMVSVTSAATAGPVFFVGKTISQTEKCIWLLDNTQNSAVCVSKLMHTPLQWFGT